MNLIFKVLSETVSPFITSNRYFSSKSTIFSLSSGYGKCGVAVIRVSGPDSINALRKLTNFGNEIRPRYAYLKKINNPATGDLIDKGLVLWFPGPNSFTGEDSCEFQVHGGLAVISALLNALSQVNGLRPAKPGEFTKRAFYAGKLDLTEVEGLADLIHAETEAQRKQALLQANGSLSKLYQKWRKILLRNIAHFEAFIDFGEDENIEDDILQNINKEISGVEKEIEKHLQSGRQGERLRNGVKTTIIGAPNVGKSSFLNLLCQRSISIVTNIAGTTRDVIETSYNVGGYPVIFADTAGLRAKPDDIVETEGITRAKAHVQESDLLIVLIDASQLITYLNENYSHSMFDYLQYYFRQLELAEDLLESKPRLIVINKSDLLDNKLKLPETKENFFLLSCKTTSGLSRLVEHLTEKLKSICGEPSAESPNLSQARHRHLLTECLAYLAAYREYALEDNNQDLAIVAYRLRTALRCIGQITGNVSTEEILDIIFKDFCVGK